MSDIEKKLRTIPMAP